MIILCPTRGRPERLREMVESACRTAARPPHFMFYVEHDDLETQHTIMDMDENALRAPVAMVMSPDDGPSEPMSQWWNICAFVALRSMPSPQREILMFVDDEAQFHTQDWDRRVMEQFLLSHDKAILVQPNDMIHDDQDAGYFFVHAMWVSIFGRITPPHFSYGYADVWPMEVARAVGRKIYLPDVVIENLAPRLQPPDAVHQANHERAVRDRPGDLYNLLQSEREQEVERLKKWIAGYAN